MLLSADAGDEPTPGANGSADEFGAALRDAYAAWIRGLCRDRPVVFALHDLHWADHWTLELVDRLVELLEDLPLLIAVTSRLPPKRTTGDFESAPALRSATVSWSSVSDLSLARRGGTAPHATGAGGARP